MNHARTLACNLEAFLNCLDEIDPIPEALEELMLQNIDMHCLYQTLQRDKSPVRIYHAGQEQIDCCLYRGQKLFPVNGIMLYRDRNFTHRMGDTMAHHYVEIWLLEDLTFAIVTCYTQITENPRCPVVSSYRENHGCDWPEQFEFDPDLFYENLRVASIDFIGEENVPYYEG